MYERLKDDMRKKHIKQHDLAAFLEVTTSTISKKLAGVVDFTLTEAHRVVECLGIDPREMAIYLPEGGRDKPESELNRPRGPKDPEEEMEAGLKMFFHGLAKAQGRSGKR